jgi:hypothetical protein
LYAPAKAKVVAKAKVMVCEWENGKLEIRQCRRRGDIIKVARQKNQGGSFEPPDQK